MLNYYLIIGSIIFSIYEAYKIFKVNEVINHALYTQDREKTKKPFHLIKDFKKIVKRTIHFLKINPYKKFVIIDLAYHSFLISFFFFEYFYIAVLVYAIGILTAIKGLIHLTKKNREFLKGILIIDSTLTILVLSVFFTTLITILVLNLN